MMRKRDGWHNIFGPFDKNKDNGNQRYVHKVAEGFVLAYLSLCLLPNSFPALARARANTSVQWIFGVVRGSPHDDAAIRGDPPLLRCRYLHYLGNVISSVVNTTISPRFCPRCFRHFHFVVHCPLVSFDPWKQQRGGIQFCEFFIFSCGQSRGRLSGLHEAAVIIGF